MVFPSPLHKNRGVSDSCGLTISLSCFPGICCRSVWLLTSWGVLVVTRTRWGPVWDCLCLWLRAGSGVRGRSGTGTVLVVRVRSSVGGPETPILRLPFVSVCTRLRKTPGLEPLRVHRVLQAFPSRTLIEYGLFWPGICVWPLESYRRRSCLSLRSLTSPSKSISRYVSLPCPGILCRGAVLVSEILPQGLGVWTSVQGVSVSGTVLSSEILPQGLGVWTVRRAPVTRTVAE